MLDFIGIGLGPFNLSLASLLHKKSALDYLFFEKKEQFDWHSGMQLPNTILQVPFMADLVSMIDPTSPFSFLNYLKDQQRLYKFYFMEQPHIPRQEYNHYCQWVADQLESIQYSSSVSAIYAHEDGFEVRVTQGNHEQRFFCRNLVIGSGNIPHLPDCLNDVQKRHPDKCLHSAQYMQRSSQALEGNIVVLGSGQSAAEIFLDLFDHQYDFDQSTQACFNLHWLTRSQGFFPMEYTPLGLEYFSPDYINHFYPLDSDIKNQQLKAQGLLYKGISAKSLKDIYQKLYHRSIASKKLHTHLHSRANLINATYNNNKVRLIFEDQTTQQQFFIDGDVVIAATGYRLPPLAFMKYLEPLIALDQHARWKISKDYALEHSACGQIYVQNQEMHTHGVGTPDLGLGAMRAATIANQLLGYALYDLPQQEQCFQHFSPEQNPHIQPIITSTTHDTTTKYAVKESKTALFVKHHHGQTPTRPTQTTLNYENSL